MEDTGYTKHLCAFIDILGYKNLVNDSEKKNNSISIIKKLEEIIGNVITEYIEHSSHGNMGPFDYEIFSDSIIITTPITLDYGDYNRSQLELAPYICYLHDKLFQLSLILSGIQMQSLHADIIFRGSISIGNHYRSSKIMFSKALVNAYTSESKNAIYPRIIIDTVYQEDALNTKEILESLVNMGILLKDNDYYFVDFIGRMCTFNTWSPEITEINLMELKELIEENLKLASKDDSPKKVLHKYIWLAKYFNFSVKYTNLKINIDNPTVVKTNFQKAIPQHPRITIYDDDDNIEKVIDLTKLKPNEEIRI
ncbi:MAG: hypothetical protein LLF98_07945 [Clostridium sp.]|uniref:hypothetical protein n=1 Tax=Clostridium sp. TaxID=1506 RepID=UPI0025B9DE22|nr:hypothetical protein [Clostridium sp.]MCE5221187.1 hypothetical protein [Clostridium sp.]